MKSNIRTRNVVLTVVLITVYSVMVLALLSIILEGAGTFVGEWLNRPGVGSYMKKNYPDVKYKVLDVSYKVETEENIGFKTESRGYVYVCRADSVPEGKYGSLEKGDVFLIKSFNFKVYYDEIFAVYNCDSELAEEINNVIFEKMSSFYNTEEYGFELFKVYADTVPAANEFNGDSLRGKALSAIDLDIVSRGDLILYVQGDNIDYGAYKKIISKAVDFYADGASAENMKLLPANLQIFYYVLNEKGERKPVYESRFKKSDIKLTSDVLEYAKNVHFKMDPDERDVIKYKAYNTVQLVYVILILATVTILSGLYVVRKARKLIKTGRVSLSAAEGETVMTEEKEAESDDRE